MSPAECGVNYSCTSVRRIGFTESPIQCLDFDIVDDGSGNLVLEFVADTQDYIQKIYPPGKYEVTISGSVGVINRKTAQSTFIVELLDPCNPPNSIEPAQLIDQTLVLGATDTPSYQHDDFVVDPAFCPVEYSYDISLLTNAIPNSAITRVDKRFFFEYLNGIEPLGQQ